MPLCCRPDSRGSWPVGKQSMMRSGYAPRRTSSRSRSVTALLTRRMHFTMAMNAAHDCGRSAPRPSAQSERGLEQLARHRTPRCAPLRRPRHGEHREGPRPIADVRLRQRLSTSGASGFRLAASVGAPRRCEQAIGGASLRRIVAVVHVDSSSPSSTCVRRPAALGAANRAAVGSRRDRRPPAAPPG